jgi:hypothetical protein
MPRKRKKSTQAKAQRVVSRITGDRLFAVTRKLLSFDSDGKQLWCNDDACPCREQGSSFHYAEEEEDDCDSNSEDDEECVTTIDNKKRCVGCVFICTIII